MKKFKLIGLEHPGTIEHPLFGVVDLANIDDKTAQELFDAGCPYLAEVLNTEKPKIEIPDTPDNEEQNKKPRK